MQPHDPGHFERDMACTEAEWLRWLPQAIGPREWDLAAGCARVRIGGGTLQLAWHEAPPRRIALLELARLHVSFAFDAVDEPARRSFMQRFDLYMHRGGG